MGRIEDELAAARKRLLDLTLRNRLLNHRASTRRTLRAVDELPRQIYETLVVLNKGMRFSPRSLATAAEGESPESAPDFSESVAWTIPNLDEPVSEKHSDLALQTELDKNQLYRRLSIISRESETLLDEQGYTGLFLALGFLKWYEAPTSEQPRKARCIGPKKRLVKISRSAKKCGNLIWIYQRVRQCRRRRSWSITLHRSNER